MIIQTWLSYNGPEKEINESPSMTEPNQVMSPREIIERYTQGREVPQFEGTYSDVDLPDLRTLDLVDIQNLSDDLRADNEAVQAEIKRRQQSFTTKTERSSSVRPEDDTSQQNAREEKEPE